jgi:hypothetical protein
MMSSLGVIVAGVMCIVRLATITPRQGARLQRHSWASPSHPVSLNACANYFIDTSLWEASKETLYSALPLALAPPNFPIEVEYIGASLHVRQ